MPIDYLPILILVIVATAFACLTLIVPTLLGPRKPTKTKLLPYVRLSHKTAVCKIIDDISSSALGRNLRVMRIKHSRPTLFRLIFLLLAVITTVDGKADASYASTAAASIELYDWRKT